MIEVKIMIFEEYMTDIEYIWDSARKAGYTYIAGGMAVAFFLAWLYGWIFG